MGQIKTTRNEVILRAPDGATLPADEGWISPTVNPFLHGCCDCGLVHRVEFAVVNNDGETVGTDGRLALRFSRDQVETDNLRGQRQDVVSVRAARVGIELKGMVTPAQIEATEFSGVPVSELDRGALVALITLLASENPVHKKEESRIILPGVGRW